MGCVIDGCPAGLKLSPLDFEFDMSRRRPGQTPLSSARKENDFVEILSGTFDGVTTGTPIALIIRNKDQRPLDYEVLSRLFRPGHADYTYLAKYGIRDYRGGGRASGRETAARVAAGVVAKKILNVLDVCVIAETEIISNELIKDCVSLGDSIGSVVSCKINGLKPGIGEPIFDKITADLAKAIISIGGAKGIEFGAGFSVANKRGSENNDGFMVKNEKIVKTSNNSGGTLGGISDGSQIYFRVAFKPPSSIAMPQKTVDYDFNETEVSVKGRHDPVIAPRACVVVEAMAAIVVVNHIFYGFTDRIENVKKAYFSLC